MELLAPAKINLHLRVGRRRDDGFHPLLTWMCTVGLFDTLTLEADTAAGEPHVGPPAAQTRASGAAGSGSESGGSESGAGGSSVPAAPRVDFDILGDDGRPDLPRDGSNLVVRIATAFLTELAAGRDHPAPLAAPPDGRAFRGEGDAPFDPAARAAAAGGGRVRATSAGAAPGSAPGTVGEGTYGSGGRRADELTQAESLPGVGRAATGPAGTGAGAVRGAEWSGRSSRQVEPVARGLVGAVRIALTKRIPIGAGLGGGSSDAAATLVGLDRLLSAGWDGERLAAFSARFGSDVPFFVAAALGHGSCACRGRGEIVRPLRRPAAKWAVVFSPPFGLSTRDVYARFDELGLGSDEAVAEAPEAAWAAWAALPARELMTKLANDLEPAAYSLSPRLGALREAIERDLGRVVRMSGSGSSLFTLFDPGEQAAAHEAAAAAGRHGVRATVVGTAPDAVIR